MIVLVTMAGAMAGPPAVWARESGIARPADAPGPGPWAAADRLRADAEGITAPGWWLQLSAVSREAVPDEWEGAVRTGFTGTRFPGVVLGWRRVGGGESTPTHDCEARLVLPWRRGRVSAGVRLLQRGSRRSLSVPLEAAVHTGGPFVAGIVLTLHPGGADGSAEAVLFATAVRGRWMGALEAGPQDGYRASVGIGITDALVWTAAVTDLDPAYGLQVRLGSLELRTESTLHRWLGTTTRVRLVWTGAGS